MFVKAIQGVSQYTRPIHTICRTYKGTTSNGAATFFFVNEEGVAITCKHVAETLVLANNINANFDEFKKELASIPQNHNFKNKQRELERKYKYSHDTTVQVKYVFINSVDKFTTIDIIPHPTLDLAILKFIDFSAKQYQSYATFVSDSDKIQQGRSLCRIGYPFPEFNNYAFNEAKNDLEWTITGNMATPSFPIDGIITRFISAPGQATIAGNIEMSTPGLKGQSGGPLFDGDGLVYGMQSATAHLHLGFDLKDHEVILNGKKSHVSNNPFLHVGNCVHVERIKEFLTQNTIKFYEG